MVDPLLRDKGTRREYDKKGSKRKATLGKFQEQMVREKRGVHNTRYNSLKATDLGHRDIAHPPMSTSYVSTTPPGCQTWFTGAQLVMWSMWWRLHPWVPPYELALRRRRTYVGTKDGVLIDREGCGVMSMLLSGLSEDFSSASGQAEGNPGRGERIHACRIIVGDVLETQSL